MPETVTQDFSTYFFYLYTDKTKVFDQSKRA